MATGYNVKDPAGRVLRQTAKSGEEKLKIVNELADSWADYCNKNWINAGKNDFFSPESKVKSFQDGLAYFLMIGSIGGAGDIVTDYKDLMHGKREIPVSSCPPCVASEIYGASCDPEKGADDTFFRSMVERLDERAAKVERPKKKAVRPRKPTPSEKIRNMLGGGTKYSVAYATVNTEGQFAIGGKMYRIDNDVEQYRPKRTAVGLLYDMDKIVVVTTAGGEEIFLDMRYDLIPREKIICAE